MRRLMADQRDVVAVRRGELPSESSSGPRWRRADLADAAAVQALVAEVEPTLVFHLASWVSGRRELDAVLPALRDILTGTVNLLTATTRSGCGRVVLAGSMEEPDPGAAPGSPYAAAKSAATTYARLFETLYGAPLVTARIFMAYGPGQRDATKLVPASIHAALAGERPRISSGRRRVDWIYVDDVVEGLVALGAAPGIEGETLDLGSGELVSVRDVVERICRSCGSAGPAVGALPDRPREVERRADVERTAQRIGFRPRVGLDEGLERTIDAQRATLSRPSS